MNDILVFDAETSIHNKGNPFDPRNFVVSNAYSFNGINTFRYYTDPDFISDIRKLLQSCSILIGFSVKFDIHWLSNMGVNVPINVKIWDCQIAEFINSGQELSYDSLDAACERYGMPRKPDLIRQYWESGVSTEHIPIEYLEEYNIHDIQSTLGLYYCQQQFLTDKQKSLVLLEGEDLRTLQSAEYNGIKFDRDGAYKLIMEQDEKVSSILDYLSGYLPDGIPSGCFNWNSGDHLSALLYGGTISFDYSVSEEATYKSGTKKGENYTRNRWHTAPVEFPQRFKPLERTEVAKTAKNPSATTRFYQTDEPTLKQLKTRKREDKELILGIQTLSAEIKVKEMAESLLSKIDDMNWQDDYIHGQFNQVVARTGRLSSSAPNLQNQPPEIDKLLVSRYDC